MFFNESVLEKCHKPKSYNFFKGSEIPYIIIWTCLGLLPLGESHAKDRSFIRQFTCNQKLLACCRDHVIFYFCPAIVNAFKMAIEADSTNVLFMMLRPFQ